MTITFRDLRKLRDFNQTSRDKAADQSEAFLGNVDTEALVGDLATRWAKPGLLGEEVRPDTELAPKDLRAAFGRSDITDPLVVAAKTLLGRALAYALSVAAPSWEQWETAVDLLRFASWPAFCDQFELRVRDASGNASKWLSVLEEGPLDVADSVLAIGDRERESVEQASELWLRNPTALSKAMFRAHLPVSSTVHTALSLLQKVDRERWFRALRTAKLPTILSESVHSAGYRLDEIHDLLSVAPKAIEQGEETNDVVAILLGRMAIGFARHVDEALQTGIRATIGEDLAARRELLEEFRSHVLSPMVDESIAIIEARDDGDEILRLMFLEVVEEASRRPWQQRDRTAEMATMNRLGHRMESLDGASSGPALWTWATSAAVASQTSGITRYLASVLATPSVKKSHRIAPAPATKLCDILLDVLTSAPQHLHSLADPASVPEWVFPSLALPLSCVSKPLPVFVQAFDQLESERMREATSMDYDARSTASRTLVLAAIAASGLMAIEKDQKKTSSELQEYVTSVWSAVRRLWLRSPMQIGGDIDHLIWFYFAWLPKSLGIDSALTAESLSYVVTDPQLALEVGRVWIANGVEPAQVVAAFNKTDAPLHQLFQTVEAGPIHWSPPEGTMALIRDFLAENAATPT